jgi:hypothetical protein
MSVEYSLLKRRGVYGTRQPIIACAREMEERSNVDVR